MGTSTQMGRTIGLKVTIYQYSTDEDRQLLVDAFQERPESRFGKCPYQDEIRRPDRHHRHARLRPQLRSPDPHSTGRKIRFATNRLFRISELYYNTRTEAYDLTAGEIDINDSDKDKTTGVSSPQQPSSSSTNKGGRVPAQSKSVEADQHYRLEQGWYSRIGMVAAQRGQHTPVFKGQESEASPVLCVRDFSGLSVSSA